VGFCSRRADQAAPQTTRNAVTTNTRDSQPRSVPRIFPLQTKRQGSRTRPRPYRRSSRDAYREWDQILSALLAFFACIPLRARDSHTLGDGNNAAASPPIRRAQNDSVKVSASSDVAQQGGPQLVAVRRRPDGQVAERRRRSTVTAHSNAHTLKVDARHADPRFRRRDRPQGRSDSFRKASP